MAPRSLRQIMKSRRAAGIIARTTAIHALPAAGSLTPSVRCVGADSEATLEEREETATTP